MSQETLGHMCCVRQVKIFGWKYDWNCGMVAALCYQIVPRQVYSGRRIAA